MSFSNYNHPNPLQSAYSDALTRPYSVDSFLVKNQNVSFEPVKPKQLTNKDYNVNSNSTVSIPDSIGSNVYIDCGNFNVIRNEISNNSTSNAKIIQKYFFTPTDKSQEIEYITKHLSPQETVIDTIPIKSQKFRVELVNESLTSNAVCKVNNTLLYYSQFNTHAHQQEPINNPVNLNIRNNNQFYDDTTLDRVKNHEYKSLRGFLKYDSGLNSKSTFWNTETPITYFSMVSPTTLLVDSSSAFDTDLKIKINGLDGLGNEITETVKTDSVNSTTPVLTSNTFLRVNSATAFITQDNSLYDYNNNLGNIAIYSSLVSRNFGLQEFIDKQKVESNTIKYAVPKNKTVLIKDIHLSGCVGNYTPQVDIMVNHNIINTTGNNIFKNVFTSRVDDNQNIEQNWKNLNIKIDELQEFYMEFNPQGNSKQFTFLNASVNLIEYPKKDFY